MSESRWTVFGLQFPSVQPAGSSDSAEVDGQLVEIFQGEEVERGDKLIQEPNSSRQWRSVKASGGRSGYIQDDAFLKLKSETEILGRIEVNLKEINKEVFANTCVRRAIRYRTNAAYLFALAWIESGANWTNKKVTSPTHAGSGAIGAYQYLPSNWKEFISLLGGEELSEDDIQYPEAQCTIAANRAFQTAEFIKANLDRDASALDLYLAHLLGDSGAKHILDAEANDSEQDLNSVLSVVFSGRDAEFLALSKRKKGLFATDGQAISIKTFIERAILELKTGFEAVIRFAGQLADDVPSHPRGSATRIHLQVEHLTKISKVKANDITNKLVIAFNEWCPKYEINTKKRMAMFLANVCVESAGFTRLDENLNYTAKRICEVWPSRFSSISAAKPYEKSPQKLANKVYGSRLGNAGIENGGWLYRGSGPIQTTGFANFKEVEDETNLPVTTQPDLLRSPDTGTQAACIFWKNRNLNSEADASQVKQARKKINGGYHGLSSVQKAYQRALQVLPDSIFQELDANIGLSAFSDALVRICKEEEVRFGKGSLKETDDPQFRHVGKFWRSIGNKKFNGRTTVKNKKTGKMERPAWSSAFISYVVKTAGGGDDFLYSEAHAHYAQDIVKNPGKGLFVAEKWNKYAPRPGDILHFGRLGASTYDFKEARAAYIADGGYPSHSDIVTSVNLEKGYLTCIGGNVSNSVKKKKIALEKDGILKERKVGSKSYPWIAVLKCNR